MSDEYDSHQRIGARCTRIRSFTSRPSEVTETREKSKGSAYRKSTGVTDCKVCERQHYIEAMDANLVCLDCQCQLAKGAK